MATTYSPAFVAKPDAGLRLDDARSIFDAIVNVNGITRAFGIAAAGTTRATATPLTSVINQLDTVASSTGVNLPLTTGSRTTPFCFCVIINNGANSVTVYGAQTGSDTINGTSGTTGVALANAKTAIYVSAKGGAWFSILTA